MADYCGTGRADGGEKGRFRTVHRCQSDEDQAILSRADHVRRDTGYVPDRLILYQ